MAATLMSHLLRTTRGDQLGTAHSALTQVLTDLTLTGENLCRLDVLVAKFENGSAMQCWK